MLKVSFVFFWLGLLFAILAMAIGLSDMTVHSYNQDKSVTSNHAVGYVSIALGMISSTCFVCATVLFKKLHH